MVASTQSMYMRLHLQLMDSKSAELERLLSQLSDVNDGMRNAMGGRNDTRAHTLTRHRDILHDYQQVLASHECCSHMSHFAALMYNYDPCFNSIFCMSNGEYAMTNSLRFAGVQAA